MSVEQLKEENEKLKLEIARLQGGGQGVKDEPTEPDADGKAVTIVILGASGDLAKKKTFPCVYNLYVRGLLPKAFVVIGYARSKLSPEDYHKQISQNFKLGTSEQKKEFLERCFYVSGQYDKDDGYKELLSFAEKKEKELSDKGANRVFYMAIPPNIFVEVTAHLSKILESKSGYNRYVIEKPFGHDLESSKVLGKQISSLVNEHQLYRIDHYLGKEMVQALLNLRFANSVFEPLFSSHYVSNVLITFKEDFGTQGRGGYFDQFGIIRDVMQNHMMQIFALVAMEPPVTLSAEDIRDEKVKLLRSVEPVSLEDVAIGQYTGKDKEPGYLDDPTVPKDSKTPTYAVTVLKIKNKRWSGTPFIMKAGKALNEKKIEVRIQFKPPPFNVFQDLDPNIRNELVLRVGPDEAIYLKMVTKKPGLTNEYEVSELDMTYKNRFELKNVPDAYERLILDVMRGDHNLFVRNDELQEAWRIFTPVLHAIDKGGVPVEKYEFGSRTTPKSDELLKKFGWVRHEGYTWKDPTKKDEKKEEKKEEKKDEKKEEKEEEKK